MDVIQQTIGELLGRNVFLAKYTANAAYKTQNRLERIQIRLKTSRLQDSNFTQRILPSLLQKKNITISVL